MPLFSHDVPDTGTYPPSAAAYADTLLSIFARGFLAGGMAATPDLTRAQMRASLAKLQALVGEKGRLAELALVDGDPSKNIGALREVELVMRDGKMMGAQAVRAAIGISGPPRK